MSASETSGGIQPGELPLPRSTKRGDEPGTYREQVPGRLRTVENGKNRHGTYSHHPESLIADCRQFGHRLRTISPILGKEDLLVPPCREVRLGKTGKLRPASRRPPVRYGRAPFREDRR